MMYLQKKVKEFIFENNLLPSNGKVIVGLSGGKDSMALLHILVGLGYECIAAHCNFHLRGEESNRDEQFVKNYCTENNIELLHTSFNTYGFMKENGISLEMAARQLRYDWFETISIEKNISKISIAHHKDDSVETILINLIRGAGIRGLTGIPPLNGKVIRPLLCLTRKEISEYIKTNNIPYVEDSTNDENIYTRNKIRLNILPMMEEINPSVKESIFKMSEYLTDVKDIYIEKIEYIIKDVFDGKNINIHKLEQTYKAKTILFEILHPYGFNNDTIDNIYQSIKKEQPGKIFYSSNYRLLLDRGYLILDEKPIDNLITEYIITEEESRIEIPLKLSIDTYKYNKDLIPDKNKNRIYVDKSKVKFPLIIRKWEIGDKFCPFGMKGQKKVSDYFTDNKFSLIDKENSWLLCNNDGKIIWIIGERADNRFRISDNTTELMIINKII